MRLNATFQIPRLDMAAYKRKLQEEMGDAITHAAFAWLGATTAVIPTWSGASLATFMPLASQVSFQLAINPVAFVDRINLGLDNATGTIEADANTGKFEFTYTTTLEHLIFNEFNNANITPDPHLFARLKRPGPYHFQEKGRRAFEESIKNVRLPAPIYKITPLVAR